MAANTGATIAVNEEERLSVANSPKEIISASIDDNAGDTSVIGQLQRTVVETQQYELENCRFAGGLRDINEYHRVEGIEGDMGAELLADEAGVLAVTAAGGEEDALSDLDILNDDEDPVCDMDLAKRSKLILNWQAVSALLVACGTIRLSAVQFEMFRTFINWSAAKHDSSGEMVPSYTKLQRVLVRCVRKYCWAKSVVTGFPVIPDRSGVKYDVRAGALAPVRIVLPSSWALLDVATSTIFECLSSPTFHHSGENPVAWFSSIEESPIVRDRTRYVDVYRYAFVEKKGSSSGEDQRALPVAVKAKNCVSITFDSSRGLESFLSKTDIKHVKIAENRSCAILKASGVLGAPLVYGEDTVVDTSDTMDQEKWTMILSAPRERTQALFGYGDIVVPVLLHTQNKVASAALFMLVYRFQKNADSSPRTTFLTIPYDAVETNRIEIRRCFVSKVTSVVSEDDELIPSSLHSTHAPHSGLLEDGRRYFVYRFLLYADDFNPYTTRKGSCGGCYMLPLGIDPSMRSGYGAVRCIGLTPPGVSTNSVLASIVPDIVKGATTGFDCLDANGKPLTVFLDAVGFIGDYPAITHAIDVLGHTACSPCHLCVFRREDGSGRGHSRYGYNARIHARSTPFVRSMKRTRVARSTNLSAAVLKELGLRSEGEDEMLPLHTLAEELEKAVAVVGIPLTERGTPVVPAVFDPYQSCVVAPDHLLSNLSIDAINAVIVLVSPDVRRLAERLILEHLSSSGLTARQNRLLSSSPPVLLSMSTSSVFCVLLLAPGCFTNAYKICHQSGINPAISEGARHRSLAERALDLLQRLNSLVAATNFFPSSRLDGEKCVHDFNRNNGMRRIEMLYSKASNYIGLLNTLCRLSEQARKHLDKPNVHRLLELYVHTIPAFGHVRHVQELIFESAHQPLKQGLRRSNHRDEQVFAVGAYLASDWESRLALEVQRASRNGSPWSGMSRLRIERLLLGENTTFSSDTTGRCTIENVFEPPILNILAAVRRRHCSSEKTEDVWRHRVVISEEDALGLTAFRNAAVHAARWYELYCSLGVADDACRDLYWFRESSRYRVRSDTFTARHAWKKRAVIQSGSFVQAVCVGLKAGFIQLLNQPCLNPQNENTDSDQRESAVWYVVALIGAMDKRSVQQDTGPTEDALVSPEEQCDPFAVVLPCVEIMKENGELHVRLSTEAEPCVLQLTGAVRECVALHICDIATCKTDVSGRGIIHSSVLDEHSCFTVLDRQRGYPPHIA